MAGKYQPIPITTSNSNPLNRSPPTSPSSKRKNSHASKRSFSDIVSVLLPSSSYIDPFSSIKLNQTRTLEEGGGGEEEDSSSADNSDESSVNSNSTDDLNNYQDDDETTLGGEDVIAEKEGLISNSVIPRVGSLKAAKLRRKNLLCALPFLALILTIIPLYLISHYLTTSGRHTFNGKGLQKISMEHLANGTFDVQRQSLDWLAEAGDGVYSFRTDDGSIELMDVNTNNSRYLVKGTDIKDENDQQLNWDTFKVSPDLDYILFGAHQEKQWRHSSHSNFYIHSLLTSKTTPLIEPSFPPRTAIASFSPSNHHVSYVFENDLYIRERPPLGKEEAGGGEQGEGIIRITRDGSKTTFNGVPDWVYEEEVFSADSTTFWSPDGTKVAFLSFDEKEVNEYEFPIYNSNPFTPGGDPYPKSVVMRYPKPGYANPRVKISVFDLASYLLANPETSLHADLTEINAHLHSLVFSKPFPESDTVITELTWVGKDDLMIKFTNRIATIERVSHFNLDLNSLEKGLKVNVEGGLNKGRGNAVVGKVVREVDYMERDGGWVEPGQFIVGIESTLLLHSLQAPSSSSSRESLARRKSASIQDGTGDVEDEIEARAIEIQDYPPGYLDIVPDLKGFNHIAYFSPPDTNEPIFLTGGPWEVDGGIKGVDVGRGIVYFISANPSIDRHLQSVPLPTSGELAALRRGIPSIVTDLTSRNQSAFHRVDFSPFNGFYVLNYEGPGIPYQTLVKVDDKNFIDVLNDNAELALQETKFAKCELIHATVESEGFQLNYAELRPPFMDLSGKTKYPVLFQVYGGPASQMVSSQFARDWKHFLASSLGYIVIQVDPRGTGFKGRGFKMGVRNNLGKLEAEDVVNAARHFASLPYIDEKRVGIWGWSYGGYLTAKVIETNSGVFTLGIAVAPVTDWRYYDTIYTERYMSTPQLNPSGYLNSSVLNMSGFKNTSFALAAGSADDNVHILNSAALLDRFTVGKVRGIRFRMFIDSDHSIRMRGAYWELMEWMTEFLLEKMGEGGRTKYKWKLGHLLGDRAKN